MQNMGYARLEEGLYHMITDMKRYARECFWECQDPSDFEERTIAYMQRVLLVLTAISLGALLLHNAPWAFALVLLGIVGLGVCCADR